MMLKILLKLLEVGGVSEPELPFKIVTPENVERFPPRIADISTAVFSEMSGHPIII